MTVVQLMREDRQAGNRFDVYAAVVGDEAGFVSPSSTQSKPIRFASRDLLSLATHARSQGYRVVGADVEDLSGRPASDLAAEMEDEIVLALRQGATADAARALRRGAGRFFLRRIEIAHPSTHQPVLITRHGKVVSSAAGDAGDRALALVATWLEKCQPN